MLKHVIIFEGIDHTGKSTAIEKLCSSYPIGEYSVTHVEGVDDNTFGFYDEILKECEKFGIVHQIFDRAMIGELVYGPMYREKSRINFEEIKRIFDKYKNVSFTININYVDKENFDDYLNLLIKRDEMYVVDYLSFKKEKWAEQCLFKVVIFAIKAFKCKNVKIVERKFIPGGKYERV